MSGVAVQSIHQNSQIWQLLLRTAQWKLLWDRFSHILLLRPWCQGFWESSEDRYRSKRMSRMLLVCYNLLNSQNITIKLHRKKSNNWPMVSFIHNVSEITTSMEHSFNTKNTKSRATFLRFLRSSFLNQPFL